MKRRLHILYLCPFFYFARTRLSSGSIAFHALFEWAAAILLLLLFGTEGLWSIWFAVVVYLAFISVYEIGYLYNDLVATRYEPNPRLRGPQGASVWWLAAWVLARVVAFGAVSAYFGTTFGVSWWLFFCSLAVALALHNLFRDNALKSATFFWLAWFRFVAPVIFLLLPSQRMGILFGGGLLYASFRLFGYLDSKGVLSLPQRKGVEFRTGYFLLPLLAVAATAGFPEAVGFQVLALYFAAIALGGFVVNKFFAPVMARLR